MITKYRKTLTILLSCLIFSLSAALHAGSPVWTLTPLTATSISVSASSTATVQYLVTNQSAKSHSLVMTSITGITQVTTGSGICSNPFTLPSRGSSCTLSLQVNGSQLTHAITDGPIVCEQGSTLQCYKPSPSNILNINVGTSGYTIGGTVSGLSGSVVLQNNGTDNETVSSDGVFTFSRPITKNSPYAVTVLTQPAGQTCTVTNGSGTVINSNVTNVSVTCVSNIDTLTASVSTLGLSVNNTELNAALTGTPRLITITNSGSNSVTNVTYSPSPALPSGTTISPSSCGTIAPSASCVLTITPGSIASATPGNTSPTPITLSISGTNTNTLTPTINVLTYGSVYQGGYIYAVDDTTSNTGSIGGSVVTLINQANTVVWSSNATGESSSSVSNDIIPGVVETSTTGSSVPTYADAETSFNSTYSNASTFPFPSSGLFASCNGRTDGACNSANILTLYNTYVTNYGIGSSPYTLSSGPTTTSFYAAGRCTETISGYSDWYLPAICEMGPASVGSGCSANTQNIVSQLPGLLGDSCTYTYYGSNCLSGYFWSSTEGSSNPTDLAWTQRFASGGESSQGQNFKYVTLSVRCSRALTL